jgi:hypothetical protein
MSSLDKFVTMVVLLSPYISGLAIALGANSIVFWFSALMFMGWIIYIYGFRAIYQFGEQQELSFVEKARGLSYIFDFFITFSLNGLAIFSSSIIFKLSVIPVVGFLLVLVEIGIPKSVFFQQVNLFNGKQKSDFHEVLSNTGSFAIYYSFLVSIMGLLIYEKANFLLTLVALVPLLFLALTAYNRERKSRTYAESLVESLKKTRWLWHYSNQKKASDRRRMKK